MSLKRYYSLSPAIVKVWHNLVGADLKSNNFNTKGENISVHYLDELSPCLLHLPASSRDIDDKMQSFLDKVCSVNSGSLNDAIFQRIYVDSFLSILNKVSFLNLIPEDSENYVLHFERLSKIISIALHYLINMPEESVIELNRCIQSGSIKDVTNWADNYPYLTYLILLAMCPDSNIKDYNMFSSEDPCAIDSKKLCELIKSNIFKNQNGNENENKLTSYVGRLSFNESLLLTKKEK